MDKLKIKDGFFTFLRIILVVFTAVLMIALPQLNCPEYVLPTITSKLIYFLYGSLALLVLYTLNILFSKKIAFKFSGIDVVLFILVLYIAINRYFIQSHYGFSIRYIELLGLCLFYIVLRLISLKNYPWPLLSIVISGIIQAIYGNLQLFGYYTSNHSGFKMTGSFFNPGPYAGFLVSVWSVALGTYLFKDNIIILIQSHRKNTSLFLNAVIKNIFEYIPLLGLISIGIILPALQSRASWIAALASSGILLELRYHFLQGFLKKGNVRFKKIIIIFLSSAILSTVLFSLYHYKKSSSDGRAFIWKITLEMIEENPVFGVGFDKFKTDYMNYQANYFSKNGETPETMVADNVNVAFNEWLQFVAENGFLGFLLLLITVFVLFKIKTETDSVVDRITKTGLLTIGVFACFSYPMQILPIKLVLVILLGILSNGSVNSDPFKKLNFNCSPSYKRTYKAINIYVFYKLIIVLMACFGIYRTYVYTRDLSQGFITWNNALKNYQYKNYNAAIVEFELAYATLKNDGAFLTNYGKTLIFAGNIHKAIALLEQTKYYQNNTIVETALGDSYKAIKQYNKAETNYKQAINMTPGKFYGQYLLAKLYDDSLQKEKAIALAQKIINKKIKIQSTAIKEIQMEMKKILIKHKNPPGLKIK